jgi:hypothetical protein
MKKIGAGCVNNGFLTALEGREIARIKRCPVCARFFLVKPSHKSACRPGCLTVIKQRRFITTSASSGRTETQASQRSRTFLRNTPKASSPSTCSLSSASFQLLYLMIMLAHDRRKVVESVALL